MKFSKRNTARALALAALSGGVAAANAAAMTLPAELTEAVASVATIRSTYVGSYPPPKPSDEEYCRPGPNLKKAL